MTTKTRRLAVVALAALLLALGGTTIDPDAPWGVPAGPAGAAAAGSDGRAADSNE